MTTFIIVCFILGGLLIGLGVMGHKTELKQKEPMRNIFSSTVDKLPHSKQFLNHSEMKGILYDDSSDQIHLINGSDYITLSKKHVLQVEIMENKESITQTSRSSQLARTAIGSLIGGGYGAIIGGLSAKKLHQDKVDELGLRLVVNDPNSPIIEFNFYKHDLPIHTTKPLYKRQYEEAYEWFKTIEVMIARADKEDKMTNNQSAN